MKFCSHCNIEHPNIHGLFSNEIVRGSVEFEYRNLTYQIWLIEYPNSHFWGWAIPTGKTEVCYNELTRLGFLTFLFEEYYMPSYIYREESLKTKDLALQDAQEGLRQRTDTILDKILPEAEEKLERLKQVIDSLKETEKQ